MSGRVFWEGPDAKLLLGDVRECLAMLPEASVQCVVTSPPYLGLRDYGNPPTVWRPLDWPDGEGCYAEPEWGDCTDTLGYKRGNTPGDLSTSSLTNPARQDTVTRATNGGRFWQRECRPEWQRQRYYVEKTAADSSAGAFSEPGEANAERLRKGRWREDATCRQSCWLGSLGLEPTAGLFVEHLVEVFRAVRRVMRNDATLWLNIGDSYSGAGHGAPGMNTILDHSSTTHEARSAVSRRKPMPGIPGKNLMLVPERLAIALQEDGWIVRSRIAWCKKACMPESTQDRPTSAWEHIWMLSKRASYYYDAEAVRQESDPEQEAHNQKYARPYDFALQEPGNGQPNNTNHVGIHSRPGPGGANLRNFWLLGPSPFPDAHFATFVPEVPRRAILAGTPEAGCCSKCGKPWERMVERSGGTTTSWNDHKDDLIRGRRVEMGGAVRNLAARAWKAGEYRRPTLGFRPACRCNAPARPSVVLDPFVGSGTTLLVARQLGRHGIGIDLSKAYCRMAVTRLEGPLFAEIGMVGGEPDAASS